MPDFNLKSFKKSLDDSKVSPVYKNTDLCYYLFSNNAVARTR